VYDVHLQYTAAFQPLNNNRLMRLFSMIEKKMRPPAQIYACTAFFGQSFAEAFSITPCCFCHLIAAFLRLPLNH
jgi:hypothetical protein